ncbi:TetR/AcrR family transcriptional regulator [Nocardioides sp. Bht2]|uniref:TetR/AcrR family transcriptional regulator n=1 Tax=Nocardioides sp. Bht2 TaxID=3392297 RepID=UPI0039B452B7
MAAGLSRRDELLQIAGELFARKGFRNTTVRDIADAAGILSGSLYHHFDSKETMVHELLDSFQTQLFIDYDAIENSELGPRAKLEAVIRRSLEAIDRNHSEVAIFQNDAGYLQELDGFEYLTARNRRFRDLWTQLLREGIEAGEIRADLDVELGYRFLRDTVWVAVRWYRPGGPLSGDEVADQYLAILFQGIGISTTTKES